MSRWRRSRAFGSPWLLIPSLPQPSTQLPELKKKASSRGSSRYQLTINVISYRLTVCGLLTITNDMCYQFSGNVMFSMHRTVDCGMVVVVMCFCFLLPPASGGESHSFPHAPMVCAVSVILAIDCRVYSPHYWECIEHNRKWVLHPLILIIIMVVVWQDSFKHVKLPSILHFIARTYVMNTIMPIMNFINDMHCICATFLTFASLDFGWTHSKFCMHTRDHVYHSISIIFRFASSKIHFVHHRDIAVVPSLGVFFIQSWLFSELNTKT